MIDIGQLLSVAGGTDVVAGGYVRVTAAGQLQLDANGGGDAWTTLASVSGTGAVTIRYLAGGSPTDLSLSRSASQASAKNMTMAMAMAAVGLVAEPLAAQLPAGDSAVVSEATARSAMVIADTLNVDSSYHGSRFSLAIDGPIATGDGRSTPGIVGKDMLADARIAVMAEVAALPDALSQGAEPAAAAAPPAHSIVAQGVMMPAAEQLQALAAPTHAGENEQLVTRLLLDALAASEFRRSHRRAARCNTAKCRDDRSWRYCRSNRRLWRWERRICDRRPVPTNVRAL